MYIGIKNGNIIAFNKTRKGLELNAFVKQVVFDDIQETDEEIVPYYNTYNDGIYFKKSQVPTTPKNIANNEIKEVRKMLYSELCDPLTSEISCLNDKISMGDYVSEDEKISIEAEIKSLYLRREAAKEKIVVENPLVL